MELQRLAVLLTDAAQAGARKALAGCTGRAALITRSRAYRLYGRANVDRWLLEGLLAPRPAPGKHGLKYLHREELEAVAASSNRVTYLPVAERG